MTIRSKNKIKAATSIEQNHEKKGGTVKSRRSNCYDKTVILQNKSRRNNCRTQTTKLSEKRIDNLSRESSIATKLGPNEILPRFDIYSWDLWSQIFISLSLCDIPEEMRNLQHSMKLKEVLDDYFIASKSPCFFIEHGSSKLPERFPKIEKYSFPYFEF